MAWAWSREGLRRRKWRSPRITNTKDAFKAEALPTDSIHAKQGEEVKSLMRSALVSCIPT